MKVKFKNGEKYNFVHKGIEDILESNLGTLTTLDLLRYRNLCDVGNGAEYNVYKTVCKNCKKYFLVESNSNKIEIDGNKYSMLCLVDANDVEEVKIEVGDKVKVTDDGLLYTTYGNFFIDNNLENYLMINY